MGNRYHACGVRNGRAGAVPDIFIARQPIFDRDLDVVGYELLFRGANQNVAVISDHDEATSTVVINAFTEFGLDTIVGDRRAWTTGCATFFLQAFPKALPPGRAVLGRLGAHRIAEGW